MVDHSVAKPIKARSGFREMPFIGSLYTHRKDPLSLYLRIMHECGDVGLFHLGLSRALLITSPELVQNVLVERVYDFDKGEALRKALVPFVGTSLFTGEGEFHRRRRKVLAPAFQPRHIINNADAIAYFGEQLQREWRDGDSIDLCREMVHVKMCIVGKVFFDADVFSETDDLRIALTTVLKHANYMLTHLFPIPLDWPVPRSIRVRKALAVLDTCILKMIAARANGKQKNDILSLLLEAKDENGDKLSKQQVRDEMLALLGAGHATAATALIWAWYLLTQHSEAYQKMQQEIDAVLQGRSPTYADLARLPYTLQVFKEALRLYPPSYDIPRFALHDMDLGGYPVRKGEMVAIGIYPMQRRPDFFPEPERFIPERFAPENEKHIPRYAYLPFGAGPRVCIGNHLTMMEGQLLLATLAQRVSFELAPGQQIQLAPNKTSAIRPRYGMRMVVRRRNTSAHIEKHGAECEKILS